ncbi:unnamed protein product [Brassica oleracea]
MQKPSFRFEIENSILSKTFVAGGCEWDVFLILITFLLYLHVANPTMLPTGWKRDVSFYFTLLNQSDKELCRSHSSCFSGHSSEEDIRRAPRHCSRFEIKEPSAEDSIHECPHWPHQYTKQAFT